MIDCDCTPRHGAEHQHRAVEHAERPLDFDREVDVARRVDDVDLVSFHWTVVAAEVIVIPRSCSSSMWSITAPSPFTSLMTWVRPA